MSTDPRVPEEIGHIPFWGGGNLKLAGAEHEAGEPREGRLGLIGFRVGVLKLGALDVCE